MCFSFLKSDFGVLISYSNFFDRAIKMSHFCKSVLGAKSKLQGQSFSRVKLTLEQKEFVVNYIIQHQQTSKWLMRTVAFAGIHVT